MMFTNARPRSIGLFSLIALLGLSLTPLCSAQENPIISVEYEATPLTEILATLGKTHDLNYVVNAKALAHAEAVTCRLKDLPLSIAVQMICASCNLEAKIMGKFVVIREPRSGEAPRFTLPSESEQRAMRDSVSDENSATKKSRSKGTSVTELFNKPKNKKESKKASESSSAASSKKKDTKAGSMQTFVGVAVSKTESSLKAKDADGEEVVFGLPRDNATGQFRANLFARLKGVRIGHRVVLMFQKEGSSNIITGFVGGRDPRKRPVITLPDDQ